jgi:two-component system, cell cycle sensor histidine kinase and response regulator CckA
MQDHDERLRQAIRAGNIGIFEHDHQTDTLYWSLELRQMYGWDPDEPADLPKIISHVHPGDMERVVATVMRAHNPEGDGAFDIEHRIVDRSGQVRWVLTRSKTNFETIAGTRRPVRTIGAVQDVTDRRRAEERLRVLDTVLSSSAQVIAITDARGIVTFANAALYRLWGHSEEEILIGRSIFDFWKLSEDPAALLERVRASRMQQLEMPATRVDGSPFYLGVTAEAVYDTEGTLAQVLLTFADVTDRKHLEAQLIHAQKIESVGRLAGGVAHDFNNLLTVISGGLELTLAMLPTDDGSREYLLAAADAAQSAAALTRQLLAFSRKEIIAPKVLDLNEVIRRAQKLILRLVGEDIALVTVCAENVAPVLFDPGQLEQIIMNLAVNARDAMESGGRLTIETSNVGLDEKYAERHLDVQPGEYVLLAVSDDGSGMTEEVRAHLFEPFFTTKAAGKGTGLGLAMVYGAVRQNGGRIEVYSEINRGTTFKIYLRAAKSVPAPSTPKQRSFSRTRTTSILLVEDDASVRSFGENVLRRLGHTVHAFPNGEEALAALGSLQPTPALLITDVVMPGLNGRGLADRVTAVFPDVRVIFVSGYTQNVIASQGVLKEGIDFLAKPYSVEQLAHRVWEVLERS